MYDFIKSWRNLISLRTFLGWWCGSSSFFDQPAVPGLRPVTTSSIVGSLSFSQKSTKVCFYGQKTPLAYSRGTEKSIGRELNTLAQKSKLGVALFETCIVFTIPFSLINSSKLIIFVILRRTMLFSTPKSTILWEPIFEILSNPDWRTLWFFVRIFKALVE